MYGHLMLKMNFGSLLTLKNSITLNLNLINRSKSQHQMPLHDIPVGIEFSFEQMC